VLVVLNITTSRISRLERSLPCKANVNTNVCFANFELSVSASMRLAVVKAFKGTIH
jgi:hypothetical protein